MNTRLMVTFVFCAHLLCGVFAANNELRKLMRTRRQARDWLIWWPERDARKIRVYFCRAFFTSMLDRSSHLDEYIDILWIHDKPDIFLQIHGNVLMMENISTNVLSMAILFVIVKKKLRQIQQCGQNAVVFFFPTGF
ncbi:hypothetical protein CRM22_007370 [Opisthorchis felineus]|uniref:Uncharacterized protein n=1 Tax=Opisthorchis felineus TaxID=147828 RepID=A0A4S2LPI3_OPIFE|nr:hypothetical protein CRM22_007370 [Opisthorchis felineus]